MALRWFQIACFASLASFAALRAVAQAPPMPNAWRHGMSYAFAVTSATRVVDDADDRGPIRLAVYIWKPLGLPRNALRC